MLMSAVDRFDRLFANTFLHRVLHKAMFGVVMVVCLGWALAGTWRAPAASPAPADFHEWPADWDGAPLRPLALGAVEERFAQRFPGALVRMTDGRRMFVLRHVKQPTRMLHPAADCYRALGYNIERERLHRDAQQRMWRCFNAQAPGGRALEVCERIVDAKGQAFTDTSAWYWAGIAGQSTGPWEAVTVARPM